MCCEEKRRPAAICCAPLVDEFADEASGAEDNGGGVEELEAVDAAVLLCPCCQLEVGVYGGYREEVAKEGDGAWAWVCGLAWRWEELGSEVPGGRWDSRRPILRM